MSTLNSSVYSSLASSEAARLLGPQLRGQEDLVAAQLRTTIQAVPGSTITARYQFKVGADGALTPTETQITTETDAAGTATDEQRGNKRPGNFLRQQARNRGASFADFLPTKPDLSPSDEATLFASVSSEPAPAPLTDSEAAAPVAQTVASAVIQGEASEADGTPIEVEILAPSGAANDNGEAANLASRAQASVAGLYARNNDIVYNANPLSELAA